MGPLLKIREVTMTLQAELIILATIVVSIVTRLLEGITI
jgi:hypothetical protein